MTLLYPTTIQVPVAARMKVGDLVWVKQLFDRKLGLIIEESTVGIRYGYPHFKVMILDDTGDALLRGDHDLEIVSESQL